MNSSRSDKTSSRRQIGQPQLQLRDDCGINQDPMHKPTPAELATAEEHARQFCRQIDQLKQQRLRERQVDTQPVDPTKQSPSQL